MSAGASRDQLPIAKRLDFLAQSEIRRMTAECERVHGLNLAQGLCDMPVPEVLVRAAQEAVQSGPNTYVRYSGIEPLRAAIADKLQRFNGLAYDPEHEIVVTSGASAAFYGACLTLLDEGSEVLLFEPYYGYHVGHLKACGAVPVMVEMQPPTWQINFATLESQITAQTKAMVVSSPHNPSGKVFSKAELLQLAGIAERHNLWVFTDEIYEHFIYGDDKHISPASLPGLRERTITISGFSKTFAITGWRIGFSAAPRAIAQRLGFTNDLVYICAPSPLQAAVAAGLQQLGDDFYEGLATTHRDKRDRICSALELAGLPPIVPDGAYYVLADLGRLNGVGSKGKVMELLRQCGVAAVAADAFFATGSENLARFCFAKTDSELDEACRRLRSLDRS